MRVLSKAVFEDLFFVIFHRTRQKIPAPTLQDRKRNKHFTLKFRCAGQKFNYLLENLAKIWFASSKVSFEPMSHHSPGTRQV